MNKKLLSLSLLLILLPLLMLVPAPNAYATNVPIGTKGHYIDEGICDPQTIDPAWGYDTASAQLISSVYDPLIRFDREHTDQFIPCLSTVVPSYENGLIQDIDVPAPHGLFNFMQRITFPIRTGVHFHNGELLTPADVEYSFERWLVQDRTGGPKWMMFEPVQGIGNYGNFYLTQDPTVQAQIIDDAFTSDANNFYMNLAERYPPIMGILAQSWGSIVCKSYFINTVKDFDGDWSHWTNWYNPVWARPDVVGHKEDGTGPFKLDYWTVGVEYSVVKYLNINGHSYWAGWPAYSAGGVYPVPQAAGYLDRATVRVVYEWSTRRDDFKAGTADTVYVPRKYISQVEGQAGIRCLKDLPTLSAHAMFFNLHIDSASPYVGNGVLGSGGIPLNFFSDIHVRKAFAYLFNVTKFIMGVWLAEATWNSDPIILGIPYDIIVGPRYYIDLVKSEEEFKIASDDPTSPAYQVWTKGFYFKMIYNTGSAVGENVTDMIKTNAKLVNPLFNIQTLGVTWSTYLGELNWYPSGRSIMPLYIMGWQADYRDPHALIMPFMHTNGYFAFPSSYSNQFVDKLIEWGIKTPDDPSHGWQKILTVTNSTPVNKAAPIGSQWTDGTHTYNLEQWDEQPIDTGHQLGKDDWIVLKNYTDSTTQIYHVNGLTGTAALTMNLATSRQWIYTELQLLYYYEVPSIMLAQPRGRRWERDWVQGWYYNRVLGACSAATTGDPSTCGLDFYQMWEGLNGDIASATAYTADGVVDSYDWAMIISVAWYTPSIKLGPYRPSCDIGPWPHYVLGQLPANTASVGWVDTGDLAVINAHWAEKTDC